MRVALDAMGGDFAPGPIVAGACEAAADQADLTVVLVGDQARIEAELAKAPAAPRDRMPIVHSSQVIGMEEKPVEALRKKRDNSISRCWGLMAAGEVEAVVSAGNTGAMVASALFNAKMFLPGVRRPGIAAIFPSHQGPIVIIDVGANMNAKAEDLYQYGIMGSIYAEEILGVTGARIGLLERRHRGRERDRADPQHVRPVPGQPLVVAVRGQRRGPRHLRRARAGRHLRRVRGERAAQGRRGGRRVPLLGAQGGAGTLDARPAGRLRPENRREPQTAQDAVRIRGVRRRAAPGHPGRLHHLPRRLRIAGDQECPPRGGHHGFRATARPDRRAARRRRPAIGRRPGPRDRGKGRRDNRWPRSASCSRVRVRRRWGCAGSWTRNSPRCESCSIGPARSSAST